MPGNDNTAAMRQPEREAQLLGGRYRLIERIGRGGVSDVWRGVDERLGREVAVKLLHEDTDDAFRRRFIRTRAQRRWPLRCLCWRRKCPRRWAACWRPSTPLIRASAFE